MNKDNSCIDEILEEYGEFIPVPIELLINPRYNRKGDKGRLSHNSAILYGFLLLLSKKLNTKDENGNLYVTTTGYEIATIVGTTTSSVPHRMITQLEEFNLIERVSTKQGQSYKLYIKEIVRWYIVTSYFNNGSQNTMPCTRTTSNSLNQS